MYWLIGHLEVYFLSNQIALPLRVRISTHNSAEVIFGATTVLVRSFPRQVDTFMVPFSVSRDGFLLRCGCIAAREDSVSFCAWMRFMLGDLRCL